MRGSNFRLWSKNSNTAKVIINIVAGIIIGYVFIYIDITPWEEDLHDLKVIAVQSGEAEWVEVDSGKIEFKWKNKGGSR